MKTICCFCGSSDTVVADYLDAADQMGTSLARHGLRMVYGAGRTGVMGALADAALDANGEVIGVIPELFNLPHLVHSQLTRLEVVRTMHQRKARMVELADAFIALPGGFGTLEELFEVLTWAQIGLHQKPIGLLNTRSYFDPLLKLIDHAYAEGFIYAEHKALFSSAEKPEQLIRAIIDHQAPPHLDRWLTRKHGE